MRVVQAILDAFHASVPLGVFLFFNCGTLPVFREFFVRSVLSIPNLALCFLATFR
jgi:hypothetical protein